MTGDRGSTSASGTAGGATGTQDRRWFAALYDSPQLFAALLDADGTLLDANRGAVEACGYERAQTVGRPVWDLGWWAQEGATAQGLRDWLARVVAGAPQRTTTTYRRADGTCRVADLSAVALLDAGSGTTHVVVTGTDITEAVSAQQEDDLRAELAAQADAARQVAVARTEDVERLRGAQAELGRALQFAGKILDNIGDGIYGLDAEGRAEFVNPAAARLTGYSQAELLSQDLHALLHARRPDGSPYPLHECPSHRARITGRTCTSADEVFWRADGTPLPISVVAVPIFDGDTVTGSVVSFRDMTPMQEAAAQAELLRQVSSREAAQRALADRLQQALLTPPPEPDHLHVVVRYRPAAREAQVGGDWYDAFLQPDGATVLVIGDVVGHDDRAAATMGQLRGILRTLGYSRDGDGPAAVLAAAERTARGLDVDALATVLLARVEREPDVPHTGARTLRWSSAGHLPPLLLTAAGRVTALRTAPDLLLGVDPDTPRTEHSAHLPDGSTLLLFTDGLVERRGESLDDGLERLQEVLGEVAHLPLPELCDALLDRMTGGSGEDDVALLAVRAHPEDRPRPAEAGPNRLPAGQR